MRTTLGMLGSGLMVALLGTLLASTAQADRLFSSEFGSLAELDADWSVLDGSLEVREVDGNVGFRVSRQAPGGVGILSTGILPVGDEGVADMHFAITLGDILSGDAAVEIVFYDDISGTGLLGSTQLFGSATEPLVAGATALRSGADLAVPVGAEAYALRLSLGGNRAAAVVDHVLVTAPEPSTILFVASGLLGIAVTRRHRA